MDRVIVQAGTKTNMYNLFEDLQNYSEDALRNVLQEIIAAGGVNGVTTANGAMLSSDTTMKVTGNVGQNYISIGEGYALTDRMDYLYVSPGTTATLTTLTSGTHSLYVTLGTYYSDPVDVMSGFAYAQAGVSQQNSRKHHSTVFTWDTDPVVSGLWLADVAVAAGVLVSITDKRQTNTLKIEQSVLPTNVMKTDAGYTQTLGNGLVLPDLTLSSSTEALLTLISGVVSEYLSYARLKDILTRVHTQGTDTGTTSTSFYVGNTYVGANDGYLAALVPETPLPPKNLRIVDSYSPTRSRVRAIEADADLAEVVRTGLISHEATISLEWNYKDIMGNGGKGTAGATDSGKFRITNSGGSKTWTANELVGYHLYITSAGKDYKITANLATSGVETVLTVTPYGHTTSIDNYSAATPPAIIHSNCDSYEIVVIPVLDSGALVPAERYEGSVGLQESPTIMQQTMNLFLGEKVIVKVRARSGSAVSVYTEMPAGTYTKTPPYATIQNYAKPYYVQLPLLDSTGAKVGANTTPSGFTITVVGWDAATDFEICYTTDASGPDFLNETHEKFTTRQRSIDVVTSGSRTYNIAVRPLISGWVVAPVKTTSVVSGAGGSVPKDNTFAISNITFKTFSGTMNGWSAGLEAWQLASLVSPAGKAGATTTLDDTIIGSIINIGGTLTDRNVTGGTDYIITDRVGAAITLTTMTGVEVGSGGGLSGNFYINTSKVARVFATATSWPTDAQLTSISIDQWSLPGIKTTGDEPKPVVRWYQYSMEAYADSLPLLEYGTALYNQTTDVTILAQNGNRTLVVDYWDPSLSDNVTGFTGSITIYWKPYIPTGRKTDNTATPPTTIAEEA